MFNTKKLPQARIFLALLLFPIIGCNHQPKPQPTHLPATFNSLPGLWYNAQLGTYEQWQTINGQLIGKAYKLHNADTILFETLQVIIKDDAIYYEATVPSQNNGKPILFKLTQHDEAKLIFSNPAHDFPQLIQYTFLPAGKLEITTRGEEEELEKEMIFRYQKI